MSLLRALLRIMGTTSRGASPAPSPTLSAPAAAASTLSASTAAAPTAPYPPRVPIPRNGVDYRGVVALAPMVRSGELPTRLLALRYGADLVWGPETIDRALIGTARRANPATGTVDFTRRPSNGKRKPVQTGSGDGGGPAALENSGNDADENVDADADAGPESVIYRLHPAREGRRLIFQLGTAAPDTAVAAARLVAGDVAGIDVNAGCPKPFSTKGGMGAALLRDPARLAAILRALVASVGAERAIGISVKIRVLPDPAETRALVRALVQTGITGLSVHCRTPAMRPREAAVRAQLRDVVGICRAAGVACLMNGDVADRDAAVRLAAEYGADGALIATAAEANPSVFRAVADGGPAAWPEVVAQFMREALAVENRWGNTKFMLGQLLPGRSAEGRACQQVRSYLEAVQALHLEDELGAQARELDVRMGLAERAERPKGGRKRGRDAADARGEVGAGAKKRARDEEQASGLAETVMGGAQQVLAV